MMKLESAAVFYVKSSMGNRHSMNDQEVLDTAKILFESALEDKDAAEELLKQPNRFVQHLQNAGITKEDFLKFARIYRENKALTEKLIKHALLPDELANQMRNVKVSQNETVLNLSSLLTSIKDWQKEIIQALQEKQTGGDYRKRVIISSETINLELFKRVKQECVNFGIDFDSVLSNPQLQTQIKDLLIPENSTIFSELLSSAQNASSQPVKEPVVAAAEKIHKQINLFINTAKTISRQTGVDFIKILKGLVEAELNRDQLNYDAIINNAQAKSIFESEDCLKMTILFHQGKFPQNQRKEQRQPLGKVDEETNKLAKQHAQRGHQGFFSQLGLDPKLAENPAELKQIVKDLVLSLHPDKGGDEELAKVAIELRALINDNQVNAYLELLDLYRRQEPESSPTPRR